MPDAIVERRSLIAVNGQDMLSIQISQELMHCRTLQQGKEPKSGFDYLLESQGHAGSAEALTQMFADLTWVCVL